MLNVSDAVKAVFNQDMLPSSFNFTIGSTLYDASHIKSGSIVILESLISGEEIDFLSVNKSELNITLGNLNQSKSDLLNSQITFSEDIKISENLTEPIPLGVYTIVESVNNGDYMLDIKAYDNLHLFDIDVAEWWNEQVTFPITIRNLLISLCEYCNVQYSFPVSFTNSTFLVSKTIEFSDVTGLEMLGYIQQATASFIKADREGIIKMITFPTTELSETTPCLEYTTSKIISVDIADYEVKKITGIQSRNSEDDVGVLVEETLTNNEQNNIYIIQENPFFSDFTGSAEDRQVLTNILNAIKNLSYTPFSGNFKGMHYIECGDLIKIHTFKNKIVYAPLLYREMSDIGLLRDSFEVNGLEYHDFVETLNRSIKVLHRRSHEFVVTLEEFRSDITEIDEEMGVMNSSITQNSSNITTVITDMEDGFTSINQTISSVNTTVNEMNASLNENGLQIFDSGDTVTTITGDGMKVNVLDATVTIDGVETPIVGEELLSATSDGVEATRLTSKEYFKLDTENVNLQLSTFYNSVHSEYQVGFFVLNNN